MRQIRPAIVIFVLLTIITGIIYPLLVTGLAMIFFPWQANGSLFDLHGHHAGSALIGQPFTSEKYFWSRLSATSPSYNSSLSSGSNYGPTNPALVDRVTSSVLEMQTRSLQATDLIPVDLVTTSASGLDPDISVASAYYQIPRVANARGIDTSILTGLVNQHIQNPQFGVLGESRINVLSLNQDLDSYQSPNNQLTSSLSTKISEKTPIILGIRASDWLQFVIFFVLLVALVIPVGRYMVHIYQGTGSGTNVFRRSESWILSRAGIKNDDEMDWKTFAFALMIFNILGIIVVFILQQIQHYLPLNPLNLGAVAPDLSLNTGVSFTTNTNWQAYAGETTLSYLTQMLGLTVQNFLSAATGMAVLVALIYGFTRKQAGSIGNFWVLLIRSIWILLPLSIIFSLILVSQGTIQNFNGPATVQLLDPLTDNGSTVAITQVIPQGPAASQIAIKLLGTNGGGYFNANSAHPYENPTPLSDILEIIALLIIPAGLCYTFGSMVGSVKKGVALLIAMLIIFIPLVGICFWAEQSGSPLLLHPGIDQSPGALQSGGNMEGKEVRFGIVHSTLFAVATTATSCGAVNSMHDSFTPLGGLIPLMMIQFGEIVFGGVGSGLGVMIVYVIIAMFIAGLMVGRTPEYLGKKIEPPEMTLAAIIILIPIVAILVGTAIAVVTDAGTSSIFNPGAHGFSEVLYAFSSAVGNNGSAFGGLSANTLFYNLALALEMFVGRFPMLILLLALAGSFAQKKIVPQSGGTLQDHRPLFIIWLVFVIVSVGVLSFLPALALGPIAEFLMQGGLMHV
nr:potassium-transporting ATPase subunit KdpA [uncultured Methanospirillum sp.]